MTQIKPQISNRELRTFEADEFRIEDRAEDGKRRIIGHAAIFDKVDGPPWFRERIAPGAFRKTIKEDDVRALFNHDPSAVLGRNKAGTLTLKEDKTGLWMEIEPPDTQLGRDLLVSIDRGDITQASFAFQTIDDAVETVDGEEVRTLKKVKLYDVSPVTYPFYQATDVALRQQEWEERNKKAQQVVPNKVKLRKRLHALKHR